MKKINLKFVSKILLFALLITTFATSSIEANAMVNPSTGKEFKSYEEYVNFQEQFYISVGASKVSPSYPSTLQSGTDEYGETTYYTFAEAFTLQSYIVPSDCKKILVSMGGSFPYIIYKNDGTKSMILRKNGYDLFGFDAKGYGQDGSCVFTKETTNTVTKKSTKKITGFTPKNIKNNTVKMTLTCDSTTAFDQVVKEITTRIRNGKITYQNTKTKKSVTVTTKKVNKHIIIDISSMRIDEKGYGTYKVTVRGDDYFTKAYARKTITIQPK